MSIRTHCRICRDPLPAPFLDLGEMPLANSFLTGPEDYATEPRYPLAVAGCGTCGLLQLTYVVPAEQLYRDYIYVSGTSDGVRAHATHLATTLVAQYGWRPSDLIVEVASNDGTVLQAFQRQGVRVLGIEPARNIAEMAVAAGVPTLPEFFTPDAARQARDAHGPASLIMGRHVFAHVDDVHAFLDGVEHLLTPDGVFIIEVPYVGDFLAHREFDTIYHEHLSYVGLVPMSRLAGDHGMRLVDVEHVPLHGGSMVLHMRRNSTGAAPSARLTAMLDAEMAGGYATPERLEAFAADVRRWKDEFEQLVSDLVAGGATLIGYGAAAKANTLLNYCPSVARSLKMILDRSPHKHGRQTPGTHVPVAPVDAWRGSGATHMIVLAWNFQQEIMRQMQPFADAGGRFVVPIPEPRVVA